MADPERRLSDWSNFKEVPQFLKSNRISLAYGQTSNKDQSFVKKVALFSCIEEYVEFVLGGMTAFDPFGSAFEVHGSRSRL